MSKGYGEIPKIWANLRLIAFALFFTVWATVLSLGSLCETPTTGQAPEPAPPAWQASYKAAEPIVFDADPTYARVWFDQTDVVINHNKIDSCFCNCDTHPKEPRR